MIHNIPVLDAHKHTKGISDSKRRQVAILQSYIQDLLENHHTFLQGSYANETSISDISDVDIVAIRKQTFSSIHSDVVCPTLVTWEDIFSEIEEKLRNQRRYDWTVGRSNSGKCIEVSTSDFKADVVPAVQTDSGTEKDPIVIYSFQTGIEKINSPRVHIENGTIKHNRTSGNYKPTVRMFKNWAKNHFQDTGIISSYQIESLLHSSPDEMFFRDPVLSFISTGVEVFKKISNDQPEPVYSVCGTEDIMQNWEPLARKAASDGIFISLRYALLATKARTTYEAQNLWNKTFNI